MPKKDLKVDVLEIDPDGVELTRIQAIDDNLAQQFGHINNGDDRHFDLNYFQTYRYTSKLDIFMIIVGIICSLGVGAALPLNFIIFKDIIDAFIGDASSSDSTSATTTTTTTAPMTTSKTLLLPEIKVTSKWFAVLGACVFFLAFIQMICWYVTSEIQARRIRGKLFHSMLYQNMGWYDKSTVGALVLNLTDQVTTIESGFGDKASIFVQYFAGFLGGFIISFIYSWRLSLVALSMVPALVFCIVSFNLSMKFFSKKEIIAYGKAGSIAEEVLSSVRTVFAFGGEVKDLKRYQDNLDEATKAGLMKAGVLGICFGGVTLCIFSSSALVFWYGSKLILDEGLAPGTVMLVFFAIIIGSISLGNALPSLEYFSNSVAAANIVFSILERKPIIDARITRNKPKDLIGKIDFRNIHFRYPNRLSAQILHNFTLSIRPGETVALVGGSGSGKSTLIQMLQRFYDPLEGEVTIDDQKLTDLDLNWYRSHVGVVQQEPHLFSGTVIENILLGKPDASREEVEQAARNANAHDFIQKLPQGYDTFIGENGGLLSGGQKQRIAIARALIRNPTILLLDEATSALDNRSEKVVQDALDRAAADGSRTVVMIAHRLTTVRNVDRIIVMDKGIIQEMGNHDELMAKQGWYYDAINNQKMKAPHGKEEVVESSKEVEVADYVDDEEAGVSYLRRLSSVKSDTKVVPPKKVQHGGALRVIKTNLPECGYMIGGCITAAISGATQPGFAVLMAQFIEVFQLVKEPDEMRRKSSMYAGIMVGIAFLGLISNFLKNFLFGVAGERLTKRLRVNLLKSILKQEIGWFDEEDNQPGILTTRLANDASRVQGISGPRLGVICETMVIFIAAFVIGFVYSWQLTLTIVAFMPLIILSGIVQGRVISGATGQSNSMESAGRTALEILGGIRTVASLAREEVMYQRFSAHLAKDKGFVLKVFILALSNGLAQSVFFFIYAAVFTLAGYLIDEYPDQLDFVEVFRVFAVITFGSAAVGRAMSFAPDAGKAMEATERTFTIIDREPKAVNHHGVGIKPQSGQMVGTLEFSNLFFHYPTRPEVKVLQGLTFSVQPGTTVALVGSSGCGKSTVMTFMTRFYEPESGSLLVDGMEIKDLDVDWLRQQCGLVSQEPKLFNRSILENIAYGDNSRDDIPMEEIIEAARQANAHSFISGLPKGYDTMVGSRGGQLSGGQKQRIAIARALIRKPKVLLLDEATSALDSESEVIVQEALDQARLGRTCLVIAHRLSTIQNADSIVVVQDGRVVEQGSHERLMNLKGAYYKFLNLDAS